ncbi:prenyltransferase, UbiA family protein [Periconia macrospinosa]|uniref:4-hydroxybenzoate polyprenyltransferase, mitochondrial n=1 Tax=Periconia macrospinosa TaxID=97972 RepID=A0A2V1D2D9_9PLEO|nr:prenyltransferase, UbiA family protein [Periconia macrospinosa]
MAGKRNNAGHQKLSAGVITRKSNSGYGGNSKRGWIGLLPSQWIPYIQLARLSPPAGLFLIYFPHLFGVLLGAIQLRTPLNEAFHAILVTFVGSFFVSNAIHIWNDLIDAPLDAKVERTQNRPIPRGAVSKRAAFIFTTTQALGAAAVLPAIMPERSAITAVLHAIPAIMGWFYYPWAKCHTNFPQAVLGFCLAWGAVIGSLAVGVELFTWTPPHVIGSSFGTHVSMICLVLASILWAMIYDTIYAHQDLKDDLKAGIKSLAVLYRGETKSLLWKLLAMMFGLLVAVGYFTSMGPLFYLVAVGGSSLALGTMIARVELDNPESCWWWFGKGFWFAGGSIAGGLLIEYLAVSVILARLF